MVRYSGVLGVEEPHQSIPNDVYRLLTEAGLKTLKDVIDFEEIDTLIPQEHRQEFHLKFSAVYYSFCFLEEIKKRISK